MDFFAIFDPISRQAEPLKLADLELLLRDQPKREALVLWRWELTDELPRPEVCDAVIGDDLTLLVSAGWEELPAGLPVEELLVVREGGRIRITGADGAPAVRCDNCSNGLIRSGDLACPHCSWDQWATPEGSLARPQ